MESLNRSILVKAKSLEAQYTTYTYKDNLQENNDATEQSLSSILSVKVRGHSGNVFVKSSAVFVHFNFFSFLKMAQEKMSKSWLI